MKYSRKISALLSHEIYDVLVETCDAPDKEREVMAGENKGLKYKPDRDSFVHEFSETEEPTNEWRFCGGLGFGGKFWHNHGFSVSCYSEDSNKKRNKMIADANEKLKVLYQKFLLE